LEREGEIGPDKKVLGLSSWPYREILLTRLVPRQFIPGQVQQSVPGFQEVSLPEGSAVMRDLNPKRPASSSTWQVAALTVRYRRVFTEQKKKRKCKGGEEKESFFMLEMDFAGRLEKDNGLLYIPEGITRCIGV